MSKAKLTEPAKVVRIEVKTASTYLDLTAANRLGTYSSRAGPHPNCLLTIDKLILKSVTVLTVGSFKVIVNLWQHCQNTDYFALVKINVKWHNPSHPHCLQGQYVKA